jgi:acyl carrier protein phosphodiesterase
VNFLAHVYFAKGDSSRIAGQLLGDFVRGPRLDQYPADIAAAIRAHRAIDSYTDRHDLSRQARDLFEPPLRRYAGIVVDVVYDHFLALDWDDYCETNLLEYTQQVDAALIEHRDVLPEPLRRFAAFMQRESLLAGNVNRSQIDLTLERIAMRSPRMAPLATAPDHLWQHEEPLRELFRAFFPQLQQHVEAHHG